MGPPFFLEAGASTLWAGLPRIDFRVVVQNSAEDHRLRALFPLPFATAKEANAFRDKEGLGLEARLVFKLGKIDVDKKNAKTSRPLPDAGAVNEELDWGAGRLVHVQLIGVRVATDFEKHLLAEKKP